MSSTNTKAKIGAAWTIGGYFFNQVLRLISNVILTRLLSPELFGLMNLVQTFIFALSLFSDLGVKAAIIRSTRWEDPVFLDTAWTIQGLRSLVIWAISFIVCYPLSVFYNEPRLIWLLPLVGFSMILIGFQSTHLAILNRKLVVGKLIIMEVIAQLLSVAIMITWASYNQSIFVLVAGFLSSSFLQLILSYRLAEWQLNHFAWEPKAVKEIFSFSKWIVLSTANSFLSYQSDKLLIGKLFPIQVLGVYAVALTFSEIPRAILGKLTQSLVYPLISRNLELPRHQLRAKIEEKRVFLIYACMACLLFLCGFGDILIQKLYDNRYHDAKWMLPLLAFGFWFNILSASIEQALVALGKAKYTALAGFSKLVYNLVAIPLMAAKYGIVGVVLVVTTNDIPYYICINIGLFKERLQVIAQDIQTTLMFVGLLSTIIGIRYFLGFGTPIDSIFQSVLK